MCVTNKTAGSEIITFFPPQLFSFQSFNNEGINEQNKEKRRSAEGQLNKRRGVSRCHGCCHRRRSRHRCRCDRSSCNRRWNMRVALIARQNDFYRSTKDDNSFFFSLFLFNIYIWEYIYLYVCVCLMRKCGSVTGVTSWWMSLLVAGGLLWRWTDAILKVDSA